MDKPEPILVGVRRELRLRRGGWRAIALESGVAYDTLTKIAQGRVDPGISKVQRLVDYFRTHPLDADGLPIAPPSLSTPTSA
jgi:hypothetical protein